MPKLNKCSFFVVLNALRAAALCRNQREQKMEHPTNGDCTSWKLPTPALFGRRTVRFEPVILAEAPKKRQHALQESNKDTFPTEAVKRSHEPRSRAEHTALAALGRQASPTGSTAPARSDRTHLSRSRPDLGKRGTTRRDPRDRRGTIGVHRARAMRLRPRGTQNKRSRRSPPAYVLFSNVWLTFGKL